MSTPHTSLHRPSAAPHPNPNSAKDPTGKDIDALAQHIKNMSTPSTPDFFNTLYDPYTPGTDFVRGYPFSMREGKPTAVSHGLWLNIPDYDAPTQVSRWGVAGVWVWGWAPLAGPLWWYPLGGPPPAAPPGGIPLVGPPLVASP